MTVIPEKRYSGTMTIADPGDSTTYDRPALTIACNCNCWARWWRLPFDPRGRYFAEHPLPEQAQQEWDAFRLMSMKAFVAHLREKHPKQAETLTMTFLGVPL